MSKRSIGIESDFPDAISKGKALFYAYVAGYELGIKWPSFEEDGKDEELLRLYLESLSLDEYDKMYVINELSDKTKKKLKQELRTMFPSIAASRRWELKIPIELSSENVVLDFEFISQFKQERIVMNDDVMDGVGSEVPEAPTVAKKAESPKTVEPTSQELTLETFQVKFNKRYRMTKDQKARGLTREQAFQEFLKTLNA